MQQTALLRSRKKERKKPRALSHDRRRIFPNAVISSIFSKSRTSAGAAIEFIIMHLCRLKLILEARVSE